MEIWIGLIELRQLPNINHSIRLTGKGAFTWITCWANSKETYLSRVTRMATEYGLFIVDAQSVMPFACAEESGIVTEELREQVERTSADQNFCIFGTFHTYRHDN